jgi:hypothetical protein
MAEIKPPVTKLSATAPFKRRRSKETPTPVWKFEIIDDRPDPDASRWAQLGRNLGPIAETASNALGVLYVSIAKVVLEWKEQFDDERAERKASERSLPRSSAGNR